MHTIFQIKIPNRSQVQQSAKNAEHLYPHPLKNRMTGISTNASGFTFPIRISNIVSKEAQLAKGKGYITEKIEDSNKREGSEIRPDNIRSDDSLSQIAPQDELNTDCQRVCVGSEEGFVLSSVKLFPTVPFVHGDGAQSNIYFPS